MMNSMIYPYPHSLRLADKVQTGFRIHQVRNIFAQIQRTLIQSMSFATKPLRRSTINFLLCLCRAQLQPECSAPLNDLRSKLS